MELQAPQLGFVSLGGGPAFVSRYPFHPRALPMGAPMVLIARIQTLVQAVAHECSTGFPRYCTGIYVSVRQSTPDLPGEFYEIQDGVCRRACI